MQDPLVPPEVDLTDFPFMPMMIARVRRSKAWLLAKKQPELGFYMVNLWMASWHEVPAASLEDDDEVLADIAMCTESRWAKVRELVLRNWVKCSDGRLYHPVVAEKAMESWKAKLDQRARTAAATAAREAKRDAARNVQREQQRDEQRNDERNVQRDVDATFTKGQGSEGTGTGKGEGSEGREVQNREVATPTVARESSGSHPAIEKIDTARAKVPAWWDSPGDVAATARTFGVERRENESDGDFRDRTWTAVQAKLAADKREANRRSGTA